MDWFEQVKFEPKQKSIKNQIVFEKATEIIFIYIYSDILEETYLYIYISSRNRNIYIYK